LHFLNDVLLQPARQQLQQALSPSVTDMPASPDAETVFRTLRELRNKW
jgi:hypothetical protein